MRFTSTGGGAPEAELREAVLRGLAPDGGLYVPGRLEPVPEDVLVGLRGAPLEETALAVARHLLGEALESGVLARIVRTALGFPIPLVRLGERAFILELFHGPTLAFKDVGARFLARLLAHYRDAVAASRALGGGRGGGAGGDEGFRVGGGGAAEGGGAGAGGPGMGGGEGGEGAEVGAAWRGAGAELVVVVATSGDTGAAVAHAFHGLAGTRIFVLFPEGQVSARQERLFTTLGGNVDAVAVAGNFDDCQHMAKEILADDGLRRGRLLTGANSINVGRLLPQIFYYVHGWAQLPSPEVPVVVSVPSGNLGNLAAGLMAKRLGVPVRRFVAATNANDVLCRFLESGRFEPRPSVPTISNAMDVGNPSNLARILHLYGGDVDLLRRDLAARSFSDEETRRCIARVYRERGYILDPHSAVGWLALEAELEGTADAVGILLATAHPAKFAEVVEPELGVEVPVPEPLAVALRRERRVTRIGARVDDVRGLLG